MNLDLFSKYLEDPEFHELTSLIKIGIYEFKSMGNLIAYMLPEILILCFLMLHEIKLQLLGLWYQIEEEVEPVLDGIERNLQRGDEDLVRQKRVETQNMCMERYFESTEEQVKRKQEFIAFEKQNIRLELEK